MRRRFFLAFLAVLAGFAATAPASAAPYFPSAQDPGFERVDWRRECWMERSPWGPRRECRRVWVDERRQWGRDRDWGHGGRTGEDWRGGDRWGGGHDRGYGGDWR